MDAYARHLRARGLRDASIHAYTGWVGRLPGDPLTLTADDLEVWIAAHDWAPATRAKCVQALHDFYRWAVHAGLITVDPSAGLRPGRVPRPTPDPCPGRRSTPHPSPTSGRSSPAARTVRR